MPRGNGQAEIYIKAVTNALGTSISHTLDWETILPQIQIGLNNTVNKTTQVTPTQALLGYNSAIDSFLEDDHIIDVTKIRDEMIARIEEAQSQQKSYFDKRRKPARQYKVGDLVLVLISSTVTQGKIRKLKHRYKGPYRVEEKLPNDRYRVVNITGRHYTGTYAAESMKPWIIFTADE